MFLKEIVINTRNLVNLTQDRDYWKVLVNAALNLMKLVITKLSQNVPQKTHVLSDIYSCLNIPTTINYLEPFLEP